MNRYRTEDSQVPLGQGGELGLKEPPPPHLMSNVSIPNTDNNLKVASELNQAEKSPSRKRSSERSPTRSLRDGSSHRLSRRHQSQNERSVERRRRRRSSSGMRSSRRHSPSNHEHDRSEGQSRYSPHRKSNSMKPSRRPSSDRKTIQEGSSSHSQRSPGETSRHHSSKRRPSRRKYSERVCSKSPQKRRSSLKDQTIGSPSHDRHHDSRRKSTPLHEKQSSERVSSRSPHRRRSRSRRQSPSHDSDTNLTSPGSSTLETDVNALSLSWETHKRRMNQADSNAYHAAISSPPFKSSKGKIDLLYGTKDDDAKAKEKAQRGGSERVINPGAERISSNKDTTISTLYGGDDSDAKLKASKGSAAALHPGVDRVFDSSSGSSIWQTARSPDTSAAKSHDGTPDSRVRSVTDTLYGSDAEAKARAKGSAYGVGSHSKATTADTLYGSDADAKAKARSARLGANVAINPGVESLYYDSSGISSATSILYGSDADAKARAKAPKYGISPGMSGRTDRTLGMMSLGESMRSSNSIGIPFEDETDDRPVARKVSISSSGSSKGEVQDRRARVSSAVIDESGPNDRDEFSFDDNNMETTGVREDAQKSRKKRLLLFLFLFLLLAGGAIAVWYFLFRSTGAFDDTQIKSSGIQDPSSAPSSSNKAPEEPLSTNSPSVTPSIWPTQELLYERPSESDCEAIANNQTIAGREQMEYADFGIDLEVVLADNITMTEILLEELMKAIQEKILPSLAGCSIVVDRFLEAWRFVIFDAFVKGSVEAEKSCIDEAMVERNCHRVFAELALFLKGSVRFLDIIRLISDEQENFANNLGLSDSFLVVKMIAAKGLTPTASPTATPSNVPSFTPSEPPAEETRANPTHPPSTPPQTLVPTSELSLSNPTLVRSNAPTMISTVERSILPTRTATSAPSSVPITSRPSWNPTSVPSEPPTMVPSIEQTDSPTFAPSIPPSLMPRTGRPSWSPSLKPTEIPAESPSSIPTKIPTKNPTPAPTVRPTPPPTRPPTLAPSPPPTSRPSSAPSAMPSKYPTAAPSSKPSLAVYFWAICGRQGFCLLAGSLQNVNWNRYDGQAIGTEIAVRCCSKVPLPGFRIVGVMASGTLCPYAASKVAGVCYNSATWSEAQALCSSVGARLCGKEELEDDCTADTGCGHDSRFAWSNTN